MLSPKDAILECDTASHKNNLSLYSFLTSRLHRHREFALTAVVLVPLLVIVTIPNLLLQTGNIDAFIYTAYIHDYRQTYAYFGPTYYSSRISAIYPARFFVWLCGSEQGYFVVRYLFLLTASVSLFAVGRRFYSAAVGLFAAILISFSPWYLRSLAYDYVDGFAITYLFAGIALLIVPQTRICLTHGLAGAFFALAVNSNLYTLAVAGAFLPSWLILRRNGSWSRSIVLMLTVFAGFFSAYVLLSTALHLEFSDQPLFIEQQTIAAARDLLKGGSAEWFQPLRDFLSHGNYYVLTPLVLLLALVTLLVQARREGVLLHAIGFFHAIVVYLAAIIAVYLVNHFLLHAGRITLIYYFSYVMVGSYLAIVALVGEAAYRVERKLQAAGLSLAATLYVLSWYGYQESNVVRMLAFGLWVFAAIFMLLLLAAVRGSAQQLALVLAFCVTSQLPFYWNDKNFHLLHSDKTAIKNWEVYRGAVHLQRVIGTVLDPAEGAVKFWYDGKFALGDEAFNLLNSIQSMYLWAYSRISGMPKIDDAFLSETLKARFLVLLGLTEAENEVGLAAIREAHIPYSVRYRGAFESKVAPFHFVVLKLLPRPLGALLATFPASGLKLESPKASLTLGSAAAELITDPVQWAYSASAPLDHAIRYGTEPLSGPAVVRVTARVEKGKLGVGLVRKDNPSSFINEAQLSEKSLVAIDVEVPAIEQAGFLMFRNVSSDGRSAAQIVKIEIFAPSADRPALLDKRQRRAPVLPAQ